MIGALFLSCALALPSRWFKPFILEEKGEVRHEIIIKEWEVLYAWMKARNPHAEFMLGSDNFPERHEGWRYTGVKWEGFRVYEKKTEESA